MPRKILRQFRTRVVKTKRRNRDGSSRQKAIRHCRVGEELVVRREPENRADPTAVAIFRESGEMVGYLEREQAVDVFEELRKGCRVQATVKQIPVTGFFLARRRGLIIDLTVWEAPPIEHAVMSL